MICYFFDDIELHLSQFDHLKRNTGYAGVIETEVEQMITSHTAKRFLRSISDVRVWLFRKILKQLFLWRLLIEEPKLIKIGIDIMVLDNNDADLREGVDPTYKEIKGFQHLQVFWGRYLVGTILRNRKAHSNHGNHVQRVVSDMVCLIRKGYRHDVPIIFIVDTEFFDQALLDNCERLKVGFIICGKMYQDIDGTIGQIPEESFLEYKKGVEVRKKIFYFNAKKKS